MRYLLSWLFEFYQPPVATAALLERLTCAGIEVENIELADPQDLQSTVIECAILANITRCQSIYGLASELAMLYQDQKPALPPLAPWKALQQTLHPQLHPDLGSRLSLIHIQGVDNRSSPQWMQTKLTACGIEPINAIVDIANYVMLELGQPLHVYDADLLPDLNLHVDLSSQGEKMLPLGAEQSVVIPPESIVIRSQKHIVALAGVVGASEYAVQTNTKKILVEAAHFVGPYIRKTMQQLKLHTDAGIRFSRGVQPLLTVLALQRYVYLLGSCGFHAEVVNLGYQNQGLPTWQIVLSADDLRRYLGDEVGLGQAERLLEAAYLEVTREQKSLVVTVDPSREDLQQPCDLIEEILRINGFEQLPETLPSPNPIDKLPVAEPQIAWRERLRDHCARMGLQEVMNYSIIPAKDEEALMPADDSCDTHSQIRLLNPLNPDRAVMRRSLLPGLLHNLALNLRMHSSAQLFEIGRVYHGMGHGKVPKESSRLIVVGVGKAHAEHFTRADDNRELDYFDLRYVWQEIAKGLALNEQQIVEDSTAPESAEYTDLTLESAALHHGICSHLVSQRRYLGWIAAIHPLVLQRFDLENHQVFALSLDLAALFSIGSSRHKIHTISRFPSIELDLSVEINQSIPAKQVIACLENLQQPWLHQIKIFDVYQGAPLASDQRALGLRLVFNAQDRTLEMAEVVAIREQFMQVLQQQLHAKIRG